MKADLDRLMDERGFDALLILPDENKNPYRTYLSNGAVSGALAIKKRGEAPVLIVSVMEVDEAAKSGLTVYSWEDFGYSELTRDLGYFTDEWYAGWYGRIFEGLGVRGTLSVYGVADVGKVLNVTRVLRERLGDVVTLVHDDVRGNIFDRAYETKDAGEMATLRSVAQRTSQAACEVRDWLSTHAARGDRVVTADGAPLTIGDVKRFLRQRLLDVGLEDNGATIFAQGRDAGMPHSRGEDDQALMSGQSIVFDLFPCEPNGYYHDMTRTWSLGYATDEVQTTYDAVMDAYRRAVAVCTPGTATSVVQRLVCEYFESLGHPTVLHTPGTMQGYVHSLAHGIGLNVHEAPWFPTFSDQYTLQAGNVFTVEPGLYYPERGYGVRIEDTVYLDETGAVESLTDVPYDLVVDLKG